MFFSKKNKLNKNNSANNDNILSDNHENIIVNDDHHIDEVRKIQEQNTILSQKLAKDKTKSIRQSSIMQYEHEERDDDEIEIRVDKSFFVTFAIVAIFLLLPIFYMIIFGKNISIDSLKNKIQNSYTNTEISASRVKLYFRPFPVFVLEDVYFVSKKENEEFALQAKKIDFHAGFGVIFGIKSGFINDITIHSGSLVIKNKTKNLKEILITLLESQIIERSKTKKINLIKLSISFVDGDGFVKSGFNVSRGILKSSPNSTKFEGGVVISSLLYDIKYSSTKDYHAIDDKEKTNINLNIDTDVFTAKLNGFIHTMQNDTTILDTKLNLNIRSLSALFASNLSNKYGVSFYNGQKDISNLSIQSTINYDITNNEFLEVSGLINQGSNKVGSVALVSKNNNTENAIDFIIKSLILENKKDYKTDIASKYYKEVMSYDNDDLSYLKTAGTQSFIKSLKDTSDGISVEDKIKKITEQQLSSFGVMDILTQTPLNVNLQVEDFEFKDNEKLAIDIATSMSDAGIVIKESSNFKFTTQNGTTTANINGTIANGINDNKKTIVSFAVESQNLKDIKNRFIDGELANNLLNFVSNDPSNKVIKLNFDFILQKDILAFDNINCSLGEQDLNIDAKMQFAAISKDATTPYRLYAAKLNNLKINIDHDKLLKFKIFNSKSYLLDKILFIKSMPFDLSVFTRCYNCTINGVVFDKFTSSLDVNANEFNFNIIEADSKMASFNLNTKIEVPFGVPTLEIDSHIDNLDLSTIDLINDKLAAIINSKSHIFVPSINQFFGYIKVYSNNIKTNNYFFNDLTFESDIANGVLKVIKANLNGSNIKDKSNVALVVNGDVSMQSTPIYSLSFGLKNFNTASVMSVFSKYDTFLNGTLDFSGRIVSKGNNLSEFFQNLSMDSSFKSYNTIVKNFDINSLALSLIDPDSKTMHILSNQDILLKSLHAGKKNIYSILQGKLVIKNGIFTFMDTLLKSNLSNTAFDGSYSVFTQKYSLVAKSAINALNFTTSSGATVPIFLSFSANNNNDIENFDTNFTQVLSYIKSYNDYSQTHKVDKISKAGYKKRSQKRGK